MQLYPKLGFLLLGTWQSFCETDNPCCIHHQHGQPDYVYDFLFVSGFRSKPVGLV